MKNKWISILFYPSLSVLLISLFCLPESGYAGPWLIKAGDLEVGFGTSIGYARSEFINDEKGTYQKFPFGGALNLYDLKLDLRYGLKKDLEMTFSTHFRSLVYSAQSIVDRDAFEQDPQGEIPLRSLDSSRAGVGDIRIGLNRQLISGSWPLAVKAELKLPTGYEKPAPNQVALGSGQADLLTLLELGHFFSTGTLVGVAGGANWRMNGPGQQAIYHFKIAQRVAKRLFLFIGQSGAHSFTQGSSTGIDNLILLDQNQRPNLFSFTQDTRTVPFSLTQNLHQAEFGFFLGTDRGVEYSGVCVIPWSGKNTSQVIGLHFDVRYRF